MSSILLPLCPSIKPVLRRIAFRFAGASCAFVWTLVACVHAAGGHHSVEDAALVEPGQCQVEVWVDRFVAASRRLVHTGSACRFAAIEWGANLDRTTVSSEPTNFSYGVQAKWVRPIVDSVTGGVLVTATWQGNAPRRFASGTVIVPLTWQASDALLLHAHLGRDFPSGSADTNRAGVALEWSPVTDWSFVAERYHENKQNFWRAGARYAINPNLSLDVSRASDIRRADGTTPAWWSLGVNWVFDR
jgi:hypothetical protein